MSKREKDAAVSNRTSAEVADWLRERIRAGALRPGQRLVEADLVAKLGASRLRVREALRRLEVEGLVEVQEFRAAFVKIFTKADILALNQAREVLEGLAARLSAERPQPLEFREAILALKAGMDAAVARGDGEAFGRLNQEFHGLILNSCGNSFVADAVERLRTPVVRLQISGFLQTLTERQNRDHHRIIAAILSAEPIEAEAAMRDHIRDGGHMIAGMPDDRFEADL